MATTSPPTSPKPSRRPDGANFFRPYGTCTSVELFPALKRRSTLARPYGTAKKKIHYKRKPVSGLRAFPFIHATNMGSRKLAGTARFVEATSGRLSDAAGSRIYGTSKAATFFKAPLWLPRLKFRTQLLRWHHHSHARFPSWRQASRLPVRRASRPAIQGVARSPAARRRLHRHAGRVPPRGAQRLRNNFASCSQNRSRSL